MGLTLRALDRHGRALADTVVASFTALVGARMVDSLDAHALARSVPGESRGYARLTGGSVAEFTFRIARPALPAGLASGRRRLVLSSEATGVPRVRTGFVRAPSPAGATGVAGALVRGPSPADTAHANADGFFAIAADSLTAAAPGYVTAAAPGRGDDLALVALGEGALLGKRIVIDPAGGGADTTRADTTRADTTPSERRRATRLRTPASADSLAARARDRGRREPARGARAGRGAARGRRRRPPDARFPGQHGGRGPPACQRRASPPIGSSR